MFYPNLTNIQPETITKQYPILFSEYENLLKENKIEEFTIPYGYTDIIAKHLYHLEFLNMQYSRKFHKKICIHTLNYKNNNLNIDCSIVDHFPPYLKALYKTAETIDRIFKTNLFYCLLNTLEETPKNFAYTDYLILESTRILDQCKTQCKETCKICSDKIQNCQCSKNNTQPKINTTNIFY